MSVQPQGIIEQQAASCVILLEVKEQIERERTHHRRGAILTRQT